MEKWQKVYKTEIRHRAEIVKAVLEDHDLSPILIDKKDSAYQFGHYEIMVLPENVLVALKLIQDEIIFE